MKSTINFSGRSQKVLAKNLAANRKAIEGTQKLGQKKQMKGK